VPNSNKILIQSSDQNNRCDVPSHAYTYPWAPNPDWPRFLAPSKDIVDYLDKVIDRLDLAKYINVNHQVAGCYWNDETGKWKVKVQIVEPKEDWASTAPLKVLSEFEDECDILFHATGILNRWEYPDIPGLWDFKGRVSLLPNWHTCGVKSLDVNGLAGCPYCGMAG
jgi:cation diffusion facilitator CzcD-associated flavoprotein CzcO